MAESRLTWSVALLLVLACLLAYANTLGGQWVWDDVSSVLLHKHVQAPSNLLQLFREDQHAFGRGQGNFYRPLTAASFMLDYWLSGGPAPDAYDERALPKVSPLLFHVSNIFWHALAAALFLALLARLNAPLFVRVAAPLLFVLHPLHTEAAAYISGRADMMSAAGIFAGLFFAVLAARGKSVGMGMVAMSLCFVAGLCSKESTLIFPALLAMVLAADSGATAGESGEVSIRPRRRFAPLIPAAAIVAIYLALRATVLRFAEGDASPAAPLAQRLYETAQSLGIYAKLLFVPTGLHMERTLDNASVLHAVAGVTFLGLLTIGAVLAWRLQHRRIALGLGWFLVAWLPISGIFPLNAPLAEHWMYVPMAGFWWALAEALHLLVKKSAARRAAYAAVAALCLVFCGLTVQRNRDWRDNERLFRATLEQNPNSARVHYNLAVAYESEYRNYAGARRHYEAYIDLQVQRRTAAAGQTMPVLGDEIEARLSLGRVLMELGDYGEAANTLAPLAQLAEVEAWRPAAALAALNVGQAMLALGELMQAHAYFDQASAIEPGLAPQIEDILAGAPVHEGY